MRLKEIIKSKKISQLKLAMDINELIKISDYFISYAEGIFHTPPDLFH